MFSTGQHVLCVCDNFIARPLLREVGTAFPVKGKVYTVRHASPRANGEVGLLLEEIINPVINFPVAGRCEPMFIGEAFRPLRDSDLDVFRRGVARFVNRASRVEGGGAG